MKGSRMSLPTQMAIGMVLGIAAGALTPAMGLDPSWYKPVGQLFINLVRMVVVPLVLTTLVAGAASVGDVSKLGRVAGKTLAYYLVTTAVAVVIGLVLANIFQPGSGLSISTEGLKAKEVAPPTLIDVFLNIVPINPIEALSKGNMLQIIFFALVLGFVLGRLGKKVETVNRFFTQFNTVMMTMINLVLKVAPVGIFCLIVRTFANLGIDGMLPMLKFILTVYGGLFLQLFVVYLILFVLFTRLNPLRFLRKILPVMLFAFSTSSSNATIPLNLETLERKCGVDEKVASFTIPLGATINMDGTAIMQGVAVIFIAQAFGIELSLAALVTVVITAVTASIGTAGVPGVGTIMLAMVFESIGLPAEGVAMIMGVDRILDMGRTAMNVTGDAVVTMCIASLTKTLDRSVFKNADS